MADAAGREFFTTRTVAEALAGFRPRRRTATETVLLGEALRRVPGEPVIAPHPLPGFARSTVDGYAVRANPGSGCGAMTGSPGTRRSASPSGTVSDAVRRRGRKPARASATVRVVKNSLPVGSAMILREAEHAHHRPQRDLAEPADRRPAHDLR